MPVSRWFVRCRDCFSIAAITEQPSTCEMCCGLCHGPIEVMGRVERDRLVRDSYEAPCDDRCTNARGPRCDCKCHGQNHGTKRIVHIVRDCGPVPRVQMPANFKARRIAAEWRTARTFAREALDRLLEHRRAGWLDRADYDRMRTLQDALHHAYTARTHDGRIRALRAVLGELPAPPAEPTAPAPLEPERQGPQEPFNASAARQAALFA